MQYKLKCNKSGGEDGLGRVIRTILLGIKKWPPSNNSFSFLPSLHFTSLFSALKTPFEFAHAYTNKRHRGRRPTLVRNNEDPDAKCPPIAWVLQDPTINGRSPLRASCKTCSGKRLFARKTIYPTWTSIVQDVLG